MVRLDKFVQQFKSVEILQLRANHNYTSEMSHSVKVKDKENKNYDKSDPTKVTVFELEFLETQFGSITLSNKTVCKTLKTYLYR